MFRLLNCKTSVALLVLLFSSTVFAYSVSVADYLSGRTDTQAINAAISAVTTSGGVVWIPEGNYDIDSTIVIPKGVSLVGAGRAPWGNAKGSILTATSNLTSGAIVQLGTGNGDWCVGLEYVRIVGRSSTIGVEIADSTYHVQLEGVLVYSGQYGFYFNQAWNIAARQLVSQVSGTGFVIDGAGPQLTFESCTAYGGLVGWDFSTAISYSSLTHIAADDADTGIEITGALRGVAFHNVGIENASDVGISLSNSNGTFVFNGLTFGDHNNRNLNLIEIDACRSAHFSDVILGSALIPDSGTVLQVAAGYEDKVFWENCYTYQNPGDIQDVVVVGGNQGNSLIFNQPQHDTLTYGDQTAQHKINSTIVVFDTDGYSRYLAGTPIFDISRVPEYGIVRILNLDGNNNVVGLRSESHTVGTGVVCHPNSTSSTIYLWNKWDYVDLMKVDGKLYELEN